MWKCRRMEKVQLSWMGLQQSPERLWNAAALPANLFTRRKEPQSEQPVVNSKQRAIKGSFSTRVFLASGEKLLACCLHF